MWGAIAKAAGGALKGIGKGIVKGAKFLGRGAKKLWKGLKKIGSKAKNEILEDASQKKKLGSNNHRFTQDVLQENNIQSVRLTRSESKRELAQEFNLSAEERSFLEGMTRPIQENQRLESKPKSTPNPNDPSVINTIEDADYEEIIDSATQDSATAEGNGNTPVTVNIEGGTPSQQDNPITPIVVENKSTQDSATAEGNGILLDESQVNTFDANPSSGSVINQVVGTLNQHIYAGPASLKHAYEVGESAIAPVNPEDLEILSTMIEEPLRQEILAQLNRMFDITADIEIAGQKRQLEALNQFNEKIESNRYLFLNQNMSFKNSLYDQSKKDDHSKKLDTIIAKYLVSKDGEVALTPDLAEHLQIIPQLADDLAAVQAQTEELDAKQNKKDQQDAENQSEQLEQNAEQNAKLDEATGILSTINGMINKVLDKLQLIPGPMEILFLILLAIDMIKDWFQEMFAGLSLSGIVEKIWSSLLKFGGIVWDLLRYWWKSVSIPGLKSSEGELVWNGGDYYFKYNSDKSAELGYSIEKSNYTDNNVKVTRRWDDKGKLVETEINGASYRSNGEIHQDADSFGAEHYDLTAGSNGLQSMKSKNSWWGTNVFPTKAPEWMIGDFEATNVSAVLDKGTDKERTVPIYRIGGPYTIYADSAQENDRKGNKENLPYGVGSYVYIYDDHGTWTALTQPNKFGFNDGSYYTADLFNKLYTNTNDNEWFLTPYVQGSNGPEKGSLTDVITTKGFGGEMQSTIHNTLAVAHTYRNTTINDINTVRDQLGGDATVDENGYLKGDKDVSGLTILVDGVGGVSTVSQALGKVTEETLKKTNIKYDNAKRESIFDGGNYADCSSLVTYMLSRAGVNLKSVYGNYSPTTETFANLIRGGSYLTAQDNEVINRYGIKTVDRGGSGKIKPESSKLVPGDVLVYRGSSTGHVVMYMGNKQYIHIGNPKDNITQFGDNSDKFQWFSDHYGYVGTLRFTKVSTRDAYGSSNADGQIDSWAQGDAPIIIEGSEADVPFSMDRPWMRTPWTGTQKPNDPYTPVVQSTDYQPDASGRIQIQPREHNDYRNKGGHVCERSNNPGNIRGTGPGSEVRTKYPGWVGITHSGSGDFSTFENQMWGIYAFYRLLATQYLPKGQNTIRTIFYKYCPPGDHGQNAPTGYIRHVSQQVGLGENEVIQKPEKNLFQALMKSVYQYEGGTQRAPMAQEDLDEAWDIFDAHFKNQTWPVVATVEPQHYGTASDGSLYASNASGGGSIGSDLKHVLGEMLKDAPDESSTDASLLASNAGTSHLDIVAEIDPNAKPLVQQGSQNPQQPKSDPKKDEALARQQDRQGSPVVINNHNYPAQQKNYQINPDAYLHRQMNDA